MHWGWPFVIAFDERFTLQNQAIQLDFLLAFGTAYLWFYATRAPSARIFSGRHSADLAKYDTRARYRFLIFPWIGFVFLGAGFGHYLSIHGTGFKEQERIPLPYSDGTGILFCWLDHDVYLQR